MRGFAGQAALGRLFGEKPLLALPKEACSWGHTEKPLPSQPGLAGEGENRATTRTGLWPVLEHKVHKSNEAFSALEGGQAAPRGDLRLFPPRGGKGRLEAPFPVQN